VSIKPGQDQIALGMISGGDATSSAMWRSMPE
jgi:hypothetical protein